MGTKFSFKSNLKLYVNFVLSKMYNVHTVYYSVHWRWCTLLYNLIEGYGGQWPLSSFMRVNIKLKVTISARQQSSVLVRDYPCITSAKRWVGGWRPSADNY